MDERPFQILRRSSDQTDDYRENANEPKIP